MELHWHHPEVFAEADRRLAKARIRDLARDHGDLLDVRIAARPPTGSQDGRQEVSITGATPGPGRKIVAARLRSDAGLALNDTLDLFERRVWRRRERRRRRPGDDGR